jgi:hypothetical protein
MTTRLACLLSLLFFMVSLSSSPARAEEVDLQLVFAVDISYSMDPEEQRLQREGYVEALRSPEVWDAISRGLLGKITLAYIEWAGAFDQQTVMDWRVIDGPASAKAFADELLAKPYRRTFRTSISGGINAAVRLIDNSGNTSRRKVIDVSGDGANNDGPLIELTRDDALAKGIVINGLPLVLKRPGQSNYVDIDNLDEYYQDCVVGGPGSFSIPVRDKGEFVVATRRKMILEIAGATPPTRFGQAGPRLIPTRDKTDCLVGEKMWRERRGNWQ